VHSCPASHTHRAAAALNTRNQHASRYTNVMRKSHADLQASNTCMCMQCAMQQ
jgi:hypothetical protein